MTNDTLNDFIHASAAQMFEHNPDRPYAQHEAMLRECILFLGRNRVKNFVRMPGNWKLTRSDHSSSGVVWQLDKQVLTYADYDNEFPNKINHLN